MFGDVISGAAPARGQFFRGLRFVTGQFRILVEIEIKRVRVGIDAVDFF